MKTHEIIAQLDAEIARLQQAKSLLVANTTTKRGQGRPKAAPTIRKTRAPMSASAREKIADAQRARWAKWKKKAKK
jgi:hypothetical protein